MIITVHTDVSYLSKAGGKSRAAGHFYLTNQNDKNFNNGAVLTLSAIIKHVMSSSSEAELSVLYWLQDGCTPTHHSRRIWAQSSQSNHNYHQQRHRTRPHHGYHDSQSLKIHGSTFSLDEMP
jgi:hypothetical protein